MLFPSSADRGCLQKRMGSPRRNAGNEKQGAWSVRDRGGGTSSPAPRAATPPWRYPHGPAHGEIPEKSRARRPPLISPRTDPAPGGGGGGAPKARAGWGGRRGIRVSPAEGATGAGEAGRSAWVSLRRRGRGGAKWITVSGELETGEGERVPPPRQPHPPWRYPHGPQHGEILGKNRARLLP